MNDIKSRDTEIHNKTMEMSNNLIYGETFKKPQVSYL